VYSPDAINWTAIPSGTGPGTSTFQNYSTNAIEVAWGGTVGNEKFIAVGNCSMAYSAEGVNWTTIPEGTGPGKAAFGISDDSENAIDGIAWGVPAGSEKFVAVGTKGRMAYSADGVNWTAIPPGTANGTTSTFDTSDIRGIAWGGTVGNEKFIAVGHDGKMAYSADGVTWTPIPPGTADGTTSTFSNTGIIAIAWGGAAGNEKFVAVGSGGKMAYSADGVNWTAIPPDPGYIRHLCSIAWGGTVGNEKFVAWNESGGMVWSTGVLE
jgi:hypothetical protein